MVVYLCLFWCMFCLTLAELGCLILSLVGFEIIRLEVGFDG